ncbi:glycoside hydrolase family 38 C-terminal domain-containing protein [Romboutsia sp.]|uniref:glycoside hydrolase family 38 N-terminal domain-containing protein n=1 Tax=Romboutsia sp. TaxID=1965302 RepID=UPI003F3CCAEF
MKNLHYIPHTHWDREWYRSSDAFRIRLTYSFDMLLDILDKNPEYKYFTFDGQTAALEDYISIRPENKEKISKYILEKRLFVGPWYIQPDLFLVSGESILRNLVIGSNIASDLGNCMEIGWVPDAFGQIQSTPQIFKELGMKAVFAWRGFNYRRTKDSVFLWEAPNGEKLLTIHFPLGYGHYRYLPNNKEDAIKDIQTVIDKVENRFFDKQLLFMGGSDHARPQGEITEILSEVNEEFEKNGYNIKISNPEEFVEDVLEDQSISKREMEVYKGEARSADLGRIHAGISSTRMDIKNPMKDYETKLPLVAEPMSVLNSLFGGIYSQSISNFFWKILFKNQFHDSIYSSSPESVNNSVENRLLNLRHGINEMIWLNFRFLRDKINFSGLNENEQPIILFNTLPYKRKDLAFVNLYVKNDNFTIKDFNNNEIEFVKLSNLEEINNEIEQYNGLLNLNDIAEVCEGTMKQVQIKIKADILPPMGYRAIKICYNESPKLNISSDLSIDEKNREIENKYLKIKIKDDGTLSVLNKKNNVAYENVLYFEEKGDDGDEYNYSPPVKDVVITTKGTKAEITLLESNSLFVKYEIVHKIDAPFECINHERSEKLETSYIVTDLVLESESQRIDFKTTIINNNKDHIIRAIFEDVYESKESLSEDHFGSVIRDNEIKDFKKLEDGATELELPIYPMQGYVKLNHDKELFAVLSKGPSEYEIYNDKSIALTLIRCVGKFGKADLKIRPGRASGYRLNTPSSQLLKEVTSQYSLYLDNKVSIGSISKEANKLKVEVMTRHLKDFTREINDNLADEFSLIELDERVEIMTLKKAEKNNDLVLRIKNSNDFDVENINIKLNDLIKEAYKASLREEEIEKLKIENNNLVINKITKNSFLTLILKAV